MKSKILAALFLAVLVLLPFGDLLWLPSDQVIAGHDLDYMFLRWWRFALDSLKQGHLPLWNPWLFSGTPFLANPQPALFYPPVWLVGLLPLNRAASALFLLHLWLAGLGTFIWLRSEGADRAGSLLGAVIFGFSGYFSARVFAGHIGVLMTQAWLPLILYFARQAIDRSSLPWALLGGLPLALSLLAGHTASFLYVGLALLAYVLYIASTVLNCPQLPSCVARGQPGGDVRAGLKPLLLLAVMGLTGLGLAAVQLLPTWEFLSHSTRQSSDYNFAASYSWPPSHLITLLIPNFFGEPLRTGYWGDGIYEELIFYVGVAPLLLCALFGLQAGKRHKLTPLLLALATAGLLLALGSFGVLHRIAYTFVPLFRATRAPGRAGFLFTFAMAALAGLLLSELRAKSQDWLTSSSRWLRGTWVWLTLALSAALILASLTLYALERDSNPQVGRLWHVANHSALFLFFFLLTLGVFWLWVSGRVSIKSRQGALLIIGLTLLDLWTFGRSIVQAAPLAESAYWRDVDAIVGDGDGRVLPWGLGVFEHNKGLAFELPSVFGYDPLELTRYKALTTSMPDPRARAYDLLNARYLVSGEDMAFPEAPESPQLIEQRGGVWLYERPNALPAAWMVHQAEVIQGETLLARLNQSDFSPTSTVLLEQAPACNLDAPLSPDQVYLERHGNNRLEAQVSAASAGILVFSEVYYPGWQAKLDGQSVPILRANYALRAVCVPPGEHHISLDFAPQSLELGAGISLFSLFLLIWGGWQVWRAKSKAMI